MAKKKVSKADSIRNYMNDHPADGPTAVATALGNQGIKVTPQQVSTTVANDRKKAGLPPAKRGPKPKSKAKGSRKLTIKPRSESQTSLGMKDLLTAKELAAKLGGVQRAKEALDALAQIQDQ